MNIDVDQRSYAVRAASNLAFEASLQAFYLDAGDEDYFSNPQHRYQPCKQAGWPHINGWPHMHGLKKSGPAANIYTAERLNA